MTKSKINSTQLLLDFGRCPDDDKKKESFSKESKRAIIILNYVNKIHECLDNIYEYLVDRQYRDFKDEVEAAIEFLEHLKEHRDKKI